MSPSQAVSQESEAFPAQNSLDNLSGWCPLAPELAERSKYSCQVATTIDAIEALTPVCKMWTHSPDTDSNYFLHNLRTDPTILHPYCITVCNEGTPRAMLMGHVRKRRVSAVVSFVNIKGPSVRVLEIKKGARMGQPSRAIDRLFAVELLKAMKSGAVDSLCLERLPLHCGLFREIQQLPGLMFKKRVPHVFCYNILSLNSPDEKRSRVFSGKINREIRRKTRVLERAFPNEVSLKCFSKPSEVDAGLRDAIRVASGTWQYHLGLGLTLNAQTCENFRFFASQGWLRIYILYINDGPCAFLAGQLYSDVFYCQYAGYLPSYARFSVGSVLTARAFEDLAIAGVQRVDLGEGGQEHNRRLGSVRSEEGTLHVYSSTPRGLLANLFFGITQILRDGGCRTRSAFRLNSLNKSWTQFLVSRRRSSHSSSELPAQSFR
jgi:hypothetical protein